MSHSSDSSDSSDSPSPADSTLQLNSSFDPHAGLPSMLQLRLDAWKEDAPKSQFQQYGPLNAYLQGHKFSSKSFLVKPQALLRCLASDVQIKAHEKKEQNSEESTSKSKGKKKGPRYSFDSHDKLVTDTRLYPDFDIDQCYTDGNLTYDVIRIVVEVGSNLDGKSLSAAQDQVVTSLRRYLGVVGNRAHGRLLGIGIVGNTACLVDVPSKTKGWMKRDPKLSVALTSDPVWISLFDKKFVQALDEMKQFCEQDNPFDNSEEARTRSSAQLEAERVDTSSDSSDSDMDVDSDTEMA